MHNAAFSTECVVTYVEYVRKGASGAKDSKIICLCYRSRLIRGQYRTDHQPPQILPLRKAL